MAVSSHNSSEPTAAEGLQAQLDQAQAALAKLQAEYETLLADSGTIQEDRDTTGQLVEDAKARVRTLQRAVENAKSGTYGICAKCGATIPPERLEALPGTVTCVRCS